ncbi:MULTISPECIES: hypothetical protein [unclassified Polaromonas]|uniref:hypothetical protein n=1 Tax=unclassified Polaromonas TaxID=2638319 RepID=UPI00129EF801|nr:MULTISPECIES: hypothetical protein [unclassified Polaromonas]QGJ18612.1 hypothetical protein F7R28_09555 [Polaromonas sp. Pch-P]
MFNTKKLRSAFTSRIVSDDWKPRVLAALGGVSLLSASVFAQTRAPEINPPLVLSRSLGTVPITSHDLLGNWVLSWPESASSNTVLVERVEVLPTYTNFFGKLASANELCPMDGTVVNNATVLVEANKPNAAPARVELQAYVGVRIECQATRIFIHGLGTPSRKAAIVGRAEVTNKASGRSVLEPIIFNRQ